MNSLFIIKQISFSPINNNSIESEAIFLIYTNFGFKDFLSEGGRLVDFEHSSIDSMRYWWLFLGIIYGMGNANYTKFTS